MYKINLYKNRAKATYFICFFIRNSFRNGGGKYLSAQKSVF